MKLLPHEIFDNIRLIKNPYARYHCELYNHHRKTVAKIICYMKNTWSVEVDNYPKQKKYYSINCPIGSGSEFKFKMCQLGLTMTYKNPDGNVP